MAPVSPVIPLPHSARDAIDASATLGDLLARRQRAQQRFDVIAPLVPVELRDRVTVGGIDTLRWVLLVDGASSAAKLRQMLPEFEAALHASGLGEPAMTIRIRGC